jgi:hypothetical protein
VKSEVESTFSLARSDASNASTTMLPDLHEEPLADVDSPLARRARRGLRSASPTERKVRKWRRRDVTSPKQSPGPNELLKKSPETERSETSSAGK